MSEVAARLEREADLKEAAAAVAYGECCFSLAAAKMREADDLRAAAEAIRAAPAKEHQGE